MVKLIYAERNRDDVRAMRARLTSCKVLYGDWRAANILIPAARADMPSQADAEGGQTYTYRLVDFDHAVIAMDDNDREDLFESEVVHSDSLDMI